MAVRLRNILRRKDGDAAVEFIMTTAMLIFVFAVLVSALVYITQYYNASFITRRVVRTIEVTGKYDEATVLALVDDLGGDALTDLDLTVDATYFTDNKIQLLDEFRVNLQAGYRIAVFQMGDRPIYVDLPIKVGLSGRSEVFWK